MTCLKQCMRRKELRLAVTQIDVHLRIVVIDLQDDEYESIVMINPEFDTLTTEIDEMQEGCLSVPGIHGVVKRPEIYSGCST